MGGLKNIWPVPGTNSATSRRVQVFQLGQYKLLRNSQRIAECDVCHGPSLSFSGYGRGGIAIGCSLTLCNLWYLQAARHCRTIPVCTYNPARGQGLWQKKNQIGNSRKPSDLKCGYRPNSLRP